MPSSSSRGLALAALLLGGAIALAAQVLTPEVQRQQEQSRQRIEAEQARLRSARVAFGDVLTVDLYLGPTARRAAPLDIRPLYLRGSIERFTTGEPHEVDERYFVVRGAYRIDDVPPDDPRVQGLRWPWQRGGWLLVDRQRARVRDLNLPDFDPFYSDVAWFRDYAAYCGLAGDDPQVFAVVWQLNQRRPALRQPLRAAEGLDDPASECAPPQWSIVEGELRVTFNPRDAAAHTYAVRGESFELITTTVRDEEARR